MPLDMRLTQTQRLTLTQTMQQSLHCLQLPALELRSFLEEAALSNPLLDVEERSLGELSLDVADFNGLDSWEEFPAGGRKQRSENDGETQADLLSCAYQQESFTDYLNQQLGQLSLLDADSLACCRYLVGCLSSSGYLDCPLDQLAEELGQELFDMEQALFIIQGLDPPGTGARSLSECLLLQLAEGSAFTEVNIHMVRFGLPLLAKNDMAGLARLLGVSQMEAEQAAKTIRSLNPIPSRGFGDQSQIPRVCPEATVYAEGGRLVIEMNSRVLPQVSLNPEYCAMLKNTSAKEVQHYLQEKQTEAKGLMHQLEKRSDTLFSVITAVVEAQRAYFLSGEPLIPMTMGQLAEQLSLSVSTISRAVKDKYIQVGNQAIPLRNFFTMGLPTADGEMAVSSGTAQEYLQRFIRAENPAAPLSDEALRQAMEGVGISLSRRTVAKYRAELGIPTAKDRKTKGSVHKTTT